MDVVLHQRNGRTAAEVVERLTLATAQDFLDIMFDPVMDGSRIILLHRASFAPAFFDLSTGLLGEITQKVANYHLQLGIIGDFSDLSESFQAYIRESNRGWTICFAGSADEAAEMLTR